MLKQLLHHIRENGLFGLTDRILLAVSGGIDSMVMLHLLKTAGFRIGVVHCNFQLRPREADREQALVTEVCNSWDVPLFIRTFDTLAFASSSGLSTQVAARELRYAFFEEMRTQHGYDFIATAHHLNDALETVLLNLTRGTGIDGLTGIPVKNGLVVRPMLFASRVEIEQYASQHNVQWLEDSSNNEDHYHRNLIRNQVIPALRKVNPSIEPGFANTLRRLEGARYLSGSATAQFAHDSMEKIGGEIRISMERVRQHPFGDVLLWELLKEFEFHFDQCREIVREHQSGKQFASGSHRLIIDRLHYIVHRLVNVTKPAVTISEGQTTAICDSQKLLIGYRDSADFVLTADRHVAAMDADSVTFPLVWRPWKDGDHFRPLGMPHHKKISDFLIDQKVPLHEKERVTVLESAGQIVWVMGYRISNNVKISEHTRRILVIEYQPSGPETFDKTQD